MVRGTYRGFTEHGEIVFGPGSEDIMKYAIEGKEIQCIYEVAKKETNDKAIVNSGRMRTGSPGPR